MKTNIALLIEQSVNVIDSLNKGLRLTPEEQLFFCEHFEREEILFRSDDKVGLLYISIYALVSCRVIQ